MGLKLEYNAGHLDEEEMDGLLIPTITTHDELNEFEQHNIEQAIQWVLGKSFKPEMVFSIDFICLIHKRMFSEVWAWAGKIRKTNKNIGSDYWIIYIELKNLLDEVRNWYENKIYTPDEIAIRFKHRIVQIHCFSDGNGRHSRFMADIIIEKIYKEPVFSWGSGNLNDDGESRRIYLKAVKTADKGDYSLLLAFARS